MTPYKCTGTWLAAEDPMDLGGRACDGIAHAVVPPVEDMSLNHLFEATAAFTDVTSCVESRPIQDTVQRACSGTNSQGFSLQSSRTRGARTDGPRLVGNDLSI